MGTFLLGALVAGALSALVAAMAWRDRPVRGAEELATVMLAAATWAGLRAYRVAAPGVESKLFVGALEWVTMGALAGTWVVFAVNYTGDRLPDRLPGGVPALVVVAAIPGVVRLTQPIHGGMIAEAGLTRLGGDRLLVIEPGPLYLVALGALYALLFVGAVPFARSLLDAQSRYWRQTVVVLGAASAPAAASVLFMTETVRVDLTPYALWLSGGGLLWAVQRGDLLSAQPIPTSRARAGVVDQLDQAVIVVDGADRIVDVNDTAAELFGIDTDCAAGASAAIPGYSTAVAEAGAATVPVDVDGERRQFEVRAVPLDPDGGLTGRVVSLYDVTETRRRVQQLSVLNRVLQHNLRNELNVVAGYAETLDGERGATIRRAVDRMTRLGDEAREAARLLDGVPNEGPVRLASTLHEVTEEVGATHPSVAIDVDADLPSDATVGPAARVVLRSLVDNAARHNDADDPRVVVTATIDGPADEPGTAIAEPEPDPDPEPDSDLDPVPGEATVRGAGRTAIADGDGGDLRSATVCVTDNGPGIPAYEHEVVGEGPETALEHGSGLGLWLVEWGCAALGGTVTFDDHEPRGTVATLTLPVVTWRDALDGDPE